jgi:hypothetical protein
VKPVLPELAQAGDAEEIFEALGVRYDSRVLARHRVHVLRRFGLCVEAFLAERPGASEGERRAALRSALREAHDLFARGAGRAEKLFRATGLERPVRLGKPRA